MIRLKYYNFAPILFCVVIIFIIMFSLIQKKSNEKEANLLPSGHSVLLEYDGLTITMDMEAFIPCVLMAEMNDESPKELLKAQAVVIRTYIMYVMGGNKQVTAKELGLPYKTPRQLNELWYSEEKLLKADQIPGAVAQLLGLGKSKIYTERMNKIHAVVAETEGKVLKIEGKLILPLFHEISNGKTRSGKEVLGEDYSYLKSVQCDQDMETESYENYKEMSVEEILAALKENRIVVFENGEETQEQNLSAQEFFGKLDYSHKDATGYIQYFVLGDVKIDGNDFAGVLGLSSSALDMEIKGNKIAFTTRGIGHGFGMSLNFAKVMAEKGENYEAILKNFFDAALVKSM